VTREALTTSVDGVLVSRFGGGDRSWLREVAEIWLLATSSRPSRALRSNFQVEATKKRVISAIKPLFAATWWLQLRHDFVRYFFAAGRSV